MKSQPRSRSAWPSAMLCSRSQPPSTQSVAEMRMPTGMRGGTTARTASNTSSGKRMRLAAGPPYSSPRAFDSGERNSCSR